MIKNIKSLGKKGMTLVEVIVAVVVISLAALMITSSYLTGLNIMRRGNERQAASDEAFTEIETGTGSAGEAMGSFRIKGMPQEYKTSGTLFESEITHGDITVIYRSYEKIKRES